WSCAQTAALKSIRSVAGLQSRGRSMPMAPASKRPSRQCKWVLTPSARWKSPTSCSRGAAWASTSSLSRPMHRGAKTMTEMIERAATALLATIGERVLHDIRAEGGLILIDGYIDVNVAVQSAILAALDETDEGMVEAVARGLAHDLDDIGA